MCSLTESVQENKANGGPGGIQRRDDALPLQLQLVLVDGNQVRVLHQTIAHSRESNDTEKQSRLHTRATQKPPAQHKQWENADAMDRMLNLSYQLHTGTPIP